MATATPWSTKACTSGIHVSEYAQVGPPWTSRTTGYGPSPAGVTTNPWRRWPAGLANDHDVNGRPAGQRAPGGAHASAPARVLIVAGAVPLARRNQTSPSGRTPAPE